MPDVSGSSPYFWSDACGLRRRCGMDGLMLNADDGPQMRSGQAVATGDGCRDRVYCRTVSALPWNVSGDWVYVEGANS